MPSATSRLALLWLAFAPCLCFAEASAKTADAAETVKPDALSAAVKAYADHVYKTYSQASASAQTFATATEAFIKAPTDETLKAAKAAWLTARDDYGRTEAFRFYEGPIDSAVPVGPEARLNSWPVNEAYIDYVKDRPTAGLINSSAVTLSGETLISLNQAKDEADISTGWHAAEFLLWGQDENKEGPGARPVSDYQGDQPAAVKRRQYLSLTAAQIAADMAALKEAWNPAARDNYAAKWNASDPKTALGKAFTGLMTLSGFELAGERIGAALDSGDQEDEQSCFSDNTRQDIIANAKGALETFMTLAPAAKAAAPDLAAKTEARMRHSVALAEGLAQPFDSILRSPKTSELRSQAEQLTASLAAQTELLKETAKALGLNAAIKTE